MLLAQASRARGIRRPARALPVLIGVTIVVPVRGRHDGDSRGRSRDGRSSAARTVCSGPPARSRTSVATVSPAASRIVTVTASARASLNEICSCLMCPAGVGEKRGVKLEVLHRRRRVLEPLGDEEGREAGDARAARTRPARALSTPGAAVGGRTLGRRAQSAPPGAKRSTVSERSPRRSVSSESTSSGAMLPRLHSRAEAVQQPHLLLALGRLEDQAVGHRPRARSRRSGPSAPRRRRGRCRPCPTRAPRRSPSTRPPRRSRSICSTHTYGAMMKSASLLPTSDEDRELAGDQRAIRSTLDLGLERDRPVGDLDVAQPELAQPARSAPRRDPGGSPAR